MTTSNPSCGCGEGAGAIVSTLLEDTCEIGEVVPIETVNACGELVEFACNAIGIPGLAGDKIIAIKQVQCLLDDDNETVCECQDDDSDSGDSGSGDSGSGSSSCSAEWIILAIEPKPICPVTKVEERENCLVEIHSQFYGHYCDQVAHAEKIADLVDCEDESSGSGGNGSGECDLSAEWSTGCEDSSGSGD